MHCISHLHLPHHFLPPLPFYISLHFRPLRWDFCITLPHVLYKFHNTCTAYRAFCHFFSTTCAVYFSSFSGAGITFHLVRSSVGLPDTYHSFLYRIPDTYIHWVLWFLPAGFWFRFTFLIYVSPCFHLHRHLVLPIPRTTIHLPHHYATTGNTAIQPFTILTHILPAPFPFYPFCAGSFHTFPPTTAIPRYRILYLSSYSTILFLLPRHAPLPFSLCCHSLAACTVRYLRTVLLPAY